MTAASMTGWLDRFERPGREQVASVMILVGRGAVRIRQSEIQREPLQMKVRFDFAYDLYQI